jgi:hypothetical protein
VLKVVQEDLVVVMVVTLLLMWISPLVKSYTFMLVVLVQLSVETEEQKAGMVEDTHTTPILWEAFITRQLTPMVVVQQILESTVQRYIIDLLLPLVVVLLVLVVLVVVLA